MKVIFFYFLYLHIYIYIYIEENNFSLIYIWENIVYLALGICCKT